ncbi:TPA: hypothetical protein ACH3X2_012093 [Trebouxia sp. C0005]
MGWIESLQRASRAPKWLPSAIRDAAKKVPKALDLRLPPSDDEKDGVWYTFTDDDRRVAQWDSSADVKPSDYAAAQHSPRPGLGGDEVSFTRVRSLLLNEDYVSSAPSEGQAPSHKGWDASSAVGIPYSHSTHPWRIAAANSKESAARPQAAGSSSLSLASADHHGKAEPPNIAAQMANTQAPGLLATANADTHDGHVQHGSCGLAVTVTNEGLAVCHQHLSNAAVDGAALVVGTMQLPRVARLFDKTLPNEVHAAVGQVVMCNMMTPSNSGNAEAIPPKQAFLSNSRCSADNVSMGSEEARPAKSLLGLLSDIPLQRGSNRAERRAKEKEEKAKASALANAERKKASRAYVARMTPAQLKEDISQDLAIAQRKLDATRQDLIKEATKLLEVKANQRAQQEAIINNLSQSHEEQSGTGTLLQPKTSTKKRQSEQLRGQESQKQKKPKLRNASKHGRLLFFQHRYGIGYLIDLHTSAEWRIEHGDDHLHLVEVEDAAELYLRTLQEHLVHELPKEGVTLVTGCGSQAQLDRVIVRLAALKGSVVDDFYLWPPAQRGTLGAVQTTVLRPHSGPDSNAGF